MQSRLNSERMQRRALWAAVASLGQLHWFFGNVYEAAVDMPQLLADAHPNRAPCLLGSGSPLRYYLPAAPVTLVATVAALIDSWRRGGDRRVIGHGRSKHGGCGSAHWLPSQSRQFTTAAQ
jgi:hypothetical protein